MSAASCLASPPPLFLPHIINRLNRKCQTAVFPTGPPPPAPDGIVPHQTATTTSFWCEDLNCQLTANSQLPTAEFSCWTSTTSSRQQCVPPGLSRQLLTALFLPDFTASSCSSLPDRTSTASPQQQCSLLPDLIHQLQTAVFPCRGRQLLTAVFPVPCQTSAAS